MRVTYNIPKSELEMFSPAGLHGPLGIPDLKMSREPGPSSWVRWSLMPLKLANKCVDDAQVFDIDSLSLVREAL